MKIKEILLELNVANIDDVKKYITGEGWHPLKGTPPPPIKAWMETQLYRYMMNNPKLARLIDKRESDKWPNWTKQALERGEEVVQIMLGSTYGYPNWPQIRNTYVTRVRSQNSTIRNWLMWEYEQNTPESQKLMKSLSHLTVPVAFKKARIWKKEEQQRKEEEQQRGLKQKEDEEQRKISSQTADKDYKVVMTFKDGYSIVEIISGECKDLEGDVMQHCMNKTYYKKMKIFSLRDPNNKAHVTIEVDPRGANPYWVSQPEEIRRKTPAGSISMKKITPIINHIKGKQNKRPIEKYRPYVAAFIKKSKFSIGKRLRQIYI